jgi:hypothetical protein
MLDQVNRAINMSQCSRCGGYYNKALRIRCGCGHFETPSLLHRSSCLPFALIAGIAIWLSALVIDFV